MPYEEFTELIKENNEEALKYFSIEQAYGVIHFATYKEVIITLDGVEISRTYTLVENTMSYKATTNLCSMPVNFLFNLLRESNNPEWVMSVIDLLLEEQNTDLVVMIQDQINKEVLTQNRTYHQVKKIEEKNYKSNGFAQKPSVTGRNTTYYWPEGTETKETMVRTTYTNTATVFIQKANTWCLNFEQQAEKNFTELPGTDVITEESYTDDDFGGLSYNLQSGQSDQLMPPEDAIPAGFEYTITSTYLSSNLLESTIERTDVWDYAWNVNVTTEKEINYEKFLGTWKNDTGRYYVGSKYKVDGKLVGYPMPTDSNAIRYPADDIAREQWQNIDELIYILGNHADTQIHEILMMYYWNIYFGENVYDIDIDALLGLFNTEVFMSFGGGSYSGGFVVKVDEINSAPILTEEELEMGLNNWLSGEALSNAKRVFDTVKSCEETRKVNAVFTYALMMQECSMGTANTSWVRENNWTSLTAYRTYTICDS
ncbi:MAG: hypothetical protein K2H53_03820 [Clostridia bacterium]|nr:hypothetical protein [Clostridia bacterium]